jgi:hypothetical protein
LQHIHLTSTFTANEPEQPAFHFALDLTGSFIFVASAKDKSLYALHVQTGNGKKPRINNITEFTVSYPILSFMVTNHERIGSKYQPQTQDCIDMQLYCIQTKAIQLYHVNSEQCFLPSPELDTLEDEEEPRQAPEEDAVTENALEAENPEPEPEPEIEEEKVPVVLEENHVAQAVVPPTDVTEALETAVDNTEAIEQVADEVINEVVKAEDEDIASQEISIPSDSELLTPASFGLGQPTVDQESDRTETVSEEASKSAESVLQLIDDSSRKNETTKKASKAKNRSKNKKPETPTKEEAKPKQVSIMTRPKPEAVSPAPSQPEEVPPVSAESPVETKPKIKKEKREEAKKEESRKEDNGKIAVQVLESTSIPAESSDSLLINELRKMENNIGLRVERTLQQQVDRLCIHLKSSKC